MAFQQTRFCGASIVNFTSSMGWGDSPSTLSVTLVVDPSNGDSLVSPQQGQPAVFAYGSFQFGGIVKSLSRNDDFGGSPIFSVTLEDPRELLSGVSMILSGYNGSVSVPNVMNIYGYLENTGGFGYSGSSSAGIPWTKARDGLLALTNGLAPSYGGAIVLGSYRFKLNLDALPVLPSYYRITSPNMSVLDFIREVCDAANHDYFFTLTTDITNSYYIVLKTINRNQEPVLGAITSFILNTPGASAKSVGYEFRNEITSKFLIGGNVSRMYGIEDVDLDDDNDELANPQDNTIWPFWGLEADGFVVDNKSVGANVIMGIGYGDLHTFTVDSRLLKNELLRNDFFRPSNGVGFLDTYTMDIGELRAARYSQEAWEAYLWLNNYNRVRFYNDLYYRMSHTKRRDDTERGLHGYETRVFRFNELGDFLGITDAIKYKRVPSPTEQDPNRYIDEYIPFLTNYSENRTAIFDQSTRRLIKEFGYYFIDYSRDLYGITNPHFGKANMLGLVGGILAGDVATFLSSRTDEELLSITAQSIGATKKKDHVFGEDALLQEKNIARIYNFVKRYADEYYGKKWMVKVPAISSYRDPETNELRFNIEPDQTGFIDESEWEDAIRENLLPFDVNRLTDVDGKFFAYVKFPKTIDIDITKYIYDNYLVYGVTDIPAGEFSFIRNGLYYRTYKYLFDDISEDDKIDSEVHNSIFIKCEVDPQIYFEDVETEYSPRVVITMPGIVKVNFDDTNDIGILADFLGGEIDRRIAEGSQNFTGVIKRSEIDRFAHSFGSDMFKLGKEGFGYRPTFAAIPMKSNVNVYGPWYASGANGRTEFEQDDTLVPWNYGGFNIMNNSANAKVTSAISSYNISEAGSIEFPDTPGLSLGDPLTDSGPYVTEITVSIDGNSGARTNYNLATWTPHPYRMRKFLSDYISRLSKTNQQLKRNFREQLRQPRQNSRLNQFKRNIIDGLRRRPRSTHLLIGGEITHTPDGKTRSIVGLQPFYNSTQQFHGDRFNSKALMSLDGLFLPFSTNVKESGYYPHFERPTESGELNIDDYNPLRSGTSLSIITHGQTFPDSISTEGEEGIDYLDARGICLKTPLILGGWGYDIDEKPVPNSGLTKYRNDKNEVVYSGEMTDSFHQDYLRRQDLWKVGPLDTKWDDDRKVWVAGSPNKNKIVQILDRLPQSGLNPRRKVFGAGAPEYYVTSGDFEASTRSGVYPIAMMYGRYIPAGSGYQAGFVYYAREWEIDYSDTIGEKVQLYKTNNYLYVGNTRPNMIEPSGFWTAYQINGRTFLDNQMQFWDLSTLET